MFLSTAKLSKNTQDSARSKSSILSKIDIRNNIEKQRSVQIMEFSKENLLRNSRPFRKLQNSICARIIPNSNKSQNSNTEGIRKVRLKNETKIRKGKSFDVGQRLPLLPPPIKKIAKSRKILNADLQPENNEELDLKVEKFISRPVTHEIEKRINSNKNSMFGLTRPYSSKNKREQIRKIYTSKLIVGNQSKINKSTIRMNIEKEEKCIEKKSENLYEKILKCENMKVGEDASEEFNSYFFK